MTGTYRGYKFRIVDTGSLKFVLFYDSEGNSVDLASKAGFEEVTDQRFAENLMRTYES